MGELIKELGEVKIGNDQYRIELNGPIDHSNGGLIHIHNGELRMDLSQLDFYKIVSQINLARENLHREKGISNNE